VPLPKQSHRVFTAKNAKPIQIRGTQRSQRNNQVRFLRDLCGQRSILAFAAFAVRPFRNAQDELFETALALCRKSHTTTNVHVNRGEGDVF
jgi:hypothetical protein